MTEDYEEHARKPVSSLAVAVIQIALFDIVFSIDSVVTAVGLAEHLSVMIAAVVFAMFIMLIASAKVGEFVERHPTVKMLALSFLLLIGHGADRRCAAFPYPARLSLLRGGVLGAGRGAQPVRRAPARAEEEESTLPLREGRPISLPQAIPRGGPGFPLARE